MRYLMMALTERTRFKMYVRSTYKGYLILSSHGGDRQYIFAPGNPEAKEEIPLITRADIYASSTATAKRNINEHIAWKG